jgi:hypothetical protein
LTKFLNELEKSGARAVLQQVCKWWFEKLIAVS